MMVNVRNYPLVAGLKMIIVGRSGGVMLGHRGGLKTLYLLGEPVNLDRIGVDWESLTWKGRSDQSGT